MPARHGAAIRRAPMVTFAATGGTRNARLLASFSPVAQRTGFGLQLFRQEHQSRNSPGVRRFSVLDFGFG